MKRKKKRHERQRVRNEKKKERKGKKRRNERRNRGGGKGKREVDLARELRRVLSARENSVNLVCLTSRLADGLGPRKSFGIPRHAYDLPVVC